MDKDQALYSFFASFDIPAYDSLSVPSDAKFPYLTYTSVTDSIGNVVNIQCRLWYRGSSWKDISLKKEEIYQRLLTMSPIKIDGGFLYLTSGTPFAQRMGDDADDLIKCYYLLVQGEFLTN